MKSYENGAKKLDADTPCARIYYIYSAQWSAMISSFRFVTNKKKIFKKTLAGPGRVRIGPRNLGPSYMNSGHLGLYENVVAIL